LEKIFSDEAPRCEGFLGASVLLGERASFQLAFCSDGDARVSAMLSGSGAPDCQCFWVEEVPSSLPCFTDSDDYFLRRTPGYYPDLLRPADAPCEVPAGVWRSLWVTLCVEELLEGPLTVRVTLRNEKNGESATAAFRFTQIPSRLPKQTLLCTHWFHADCLATYYDVPVFSEAHWAILERYIRCAAEQGINLLLTPLFTPPLDTAVGGERPTVQLCAVSRKNNKYYFDFSRLDRWFRLCRACGIERFELSPLFTQWGARFAPKIMATVEGKPCRLFGWETDADSEDYTDFLTQLAAALLPFLEQAGVKELCYLHVSDEPSEEDLEVYARRCALLRRIFPGLPTLDALSSLAIYKTGLVECPVPANSHIEAFVGEVSQLWTYYCCGQHKDYVSNRFFAMPSLRNRVLGFQLWKYRCTGFLHWGFNFWYARFSTRALDPFTETDAGGSFPSGDAFQVYPGADGVALLSLRLRVFYEALQDQRALQRLEELTGYDATLAVLEEGLETPLTFKEYPHSEAWLLTARERINAAILLASRG
jgi:hypothetical protein